MKEIVSKIMHKFSQLDKAEQRIIEENTKHNMDNYIATRRVLHQLALKLAKETEEL